MQQIMFEKREKKLGTAVLLVTAASLIIGTALSLMKVAGSEPPHSEPHAGHGKPGSEIVQMHTNAIYLDVHEQKDLTLELKSPLATGTLSLHLETDDGLLIASQQTVWEFDLAKTQHLILPVTLYGASAGHHNIHVFATYTNPLGQQTARALAQQVDVGKGELAVNAYKSSAEPQMEFVRMKAVEVVR